MAPNLLELQSLSQYYTSGQSVVMGLDHIDLRFQKGEFVAVTGESGSGKTTLARVAAGILPYESGELLVSGRPTSHYDGADWERHRSSMVSFISQNYDILPGCSVLGNVVSALRLIGIRAADAKRQAEEILRKVDLYELRSRRAAKLSSGQKQRLAIARALARPAPILIADEPTGNLDAENSAQIIRLLADAAQERLVLLITHEFDEVKDVATRRISIRNGAVESDQILRDTPRQESAAAEPPPPASGRGLGLYTAALQLRARPVWSGVMLLFFLLTAFAAFAFLGTFIVHLDDTYTRIYDNSAFRNGEMTRIVAERHDGEAMTDEDYARLLALEYVTSIECYGYVTDLSYAYREDVDYRFTHGLDSAGGGTFSEKLRFSFLDTENFVKTVPLSAEGTPDLVAGRLPEAVYEVLAVAGEYALGDRIPVYIQDRKSWNYDAYLKLEAEVVGLLERGEGLYFSDLLGEVLTDAVCGGQFIIMPREDDALRTVSQVDLALDGRFYCSSRLYQQQRFGQYGNVRTGEVIHFLEFPDPNGGETPIRLEYLDLCESTYLWYIEVAPELYAELTTVDGSDQVSITIEDYAYADRVIAAIEAEGYAAISPYQEGSAKQSAKLAAQRLQTLRVCLISFVAVLILQVILLRAMFHMQMESYRMLSTLGLARRTASRSILWQVLLLAALGQLLAAAGLYACARLEIERIVHILRYLPTLYMVLLSGIHFAVSLLTALGILRSLRRLVYPFGRRFTDLNLDEYPVEVSE